MNKVYIAAASAAGCIALYLIYKVNQKGVGGISKDMVSGVIGAAGSAWNGAILGAGEAVGLTPMDKQKAADMFGTNEDWRAALSMSNIAAIPGNLADAIAGEWRRLSDSIWATESTF